MEYELQLVERGGGGPGAVEGWGVDVGDPYVDLVYGPLLGATAILILRYLHASVPLRPGPLCSLAELAAAAGSRPRRVVGPLRRLGRYRLIVIHPPPAAPLERGDPDDADLGAPPTGRLLLPTRLPLVSTGAIERLPPLAADLARRRAGEER